MSSWERMPEPRRDWDRWRVAAACGAGLLGLGATAGALIALQRRREAAEARRARRLFRSLSRLREAVMLDKRLARALPAASALAKRAHLDDKRVLAGGGVVLAFTAGAVAVAALNARKTGGGTSEAPQDKAVRRAVTINKPRAELYRRWRDFREAPRWMDIVESVTETEDGRLHWVVRAPGGKRIAFEAVITEDHDGEVLAWESVPGAKIRSSSRLEFREAPGGRGTEIHASMDYRPPFGPLGRAAALIGQKAPEFQIQRDLRRFKQLVETGEIATTEGPGAAPSSRDKA